MMKLNLGCGFNKREGWVNLDSNPACAPDVLHDLETFPWPIESDSCDEIYASNVLEHLGQQTSVFLKIIQELYRICRNGTRIEVRLPHPRSDDYIGDPTHVRPIIPQTLALFSKRGNQYHREVHSGATPLAFTLDVDFEIRDITYLLGEPWQSDKEIIVIWEAIKPEA